MSDNSVMGKGVKPDPNNQQVLLSALVDNSSNDTKEVCKQIQEKKPADIEQMTPEQTLKWIKDCTTNIRNNKTEDRVMMSSVVRFLFDQMKENDFESEEALHVFTGFIDEYIQKIRLAMEQIENDKNPTDTDDKKGALGILVRICDYSILAQTLIAKWFQPLAKSKKSVVDATKVAEQAKESAIDATNNARNLLGQIASIIAIFTALSFAVVGGLSTLDSLLHNANKVDMLLVGSIWALVMVVIFVLLGGILILILSNNLKGEYYENRRIGVYITLMIAIIIIVFSCGLTIRKYMPESIAASNTTISTNVDEQQSDDSDTVNTIENINTTTTSSAQ